MIDKEKLQAGLKAYREKIASGEITPSEAIDPIEKSKRNPKSLRLAINAKCWECSSLSRHEVTACSVTACPLHLHRPWQKQQNV